MDQEQTSTPPELNEQELAPLQIIRIDSELSKYPIHNLAKKGRVNIEIKKLKPNGQVDVKWEVSYSEKYGQARQLAYKLDTLIINRRFDEESRPLPELIRLGSLNELCAELGSQKTELKKALFANAFAAITAKLRYRGNDGTEKTLEAGFTRYSIILTGETLPDGRKADAVFLVLNKIYRDVLNTVPVRPLNYEYLKVLKPAAQRFYEIISRNIFATLSKHGEFALLRYSDYCTYSAQKRHFDYENFRVQMAKIHKDHLASGYITKVEYEQKTDDQDRVDWLMKYTPGPKARAEFRAFTKDPKALLVRTARRGRPRKGESLAKVLTETPAPQPLSVKVNRFWEQSSLELLPASLQPPITEPHPATEQLPLTPAPEATVDLSLLAEMTRRGIAEGEARKLLQQLPTEQQVLDQLEWGDFQIEVSQRDPARAIQNPPGFYISLLRGNVTPPPTFESSQKKAARLEANLALQAIQLRREEQEAAYEDYCRKEISLYVADPAHQAEVQDLLARKQPPARQTFPRMTDEQLVPVVQGMIRAELKAQLPLLTFEAFCQRQGNDTAASSTALAAPTPVVPSPSVASDRKTDGSPASPAATPDSTSSPAPPPHSEA